MFNKNLNSTELTHSLLGMLKNNEKRWKQNEIEPRKKRLKDGNAKVEEIAKLDNHLMCA